MLMQSHETDQSGTTIINLLPALPSEWSTGSVSGLKARGGYEVDIVWSNGALESVSLVSKEAKVCKLRIGDKIIDVELTAGAKQTITEFK